MDYIVDLPRSVDWEGNEFSAMFVVVYRMTKQVHVTPCDNLTTRHAAYMFYRDVFRLHGLPSAEFAINNYDTQTTEISPFLAVYGLHLRSGPECSFHQASSPSPSSIRFERLDAEELILNAKRVDKFIVENLKMHSAEQEIQANKHRTAARDFKVNDLVWLNFDGKDLVLKTTSIFQLLKLQVSKI